MTVGALCWFAPAPRSSRIHGEAQAFGLSFGLADFWWRSAEIGSIFASFPAGFSPNAMPVSIDTPSESATAHGVTTASHSETRLSGCVPTSPSPTPSIDVAEHRPRETDHVVVPAWHSFLMNRADVQELTVSFLRTGRFHG